VPFKQLEGDCAQQGPRETMLEIDISSFLFYMTKANGILPPATGGGRNKKKKKRSGITKSLIEFSSTLSEQK
jgi:hypothetical protein